MHICIQYITIYIYSIYIYIEFISLTRMHNYTLIESLKDMSLSTLGRLAKRSFCLLVMCKRLSNIRTGILVNNSNNNYCTTMLRSV